MELEVGQFARLKSGYICKIININDYREPNMKYGVEANYLKDIMFIGDDDIVKASYNIIDILEKGDYVNGSKILGFENEYIKEDDKFVPFGIITENCYLDNNSWLTEKDIKSIVTKEQFESMKYSLEG